MANLDDFIKTIRQKIYGSDVPVPLSDNEIISVILTYPACLIASSDGRVDDAERLFLMSISEILGDNDSSSAENRLQAAERYRAFMWLLNSGEDTENFILSNLAMFCEESQDLQNQILSSMNGVAESSEGVSELELDKINEISSKLGFKNNLN
tara:strand:+ start:2477 stop:2935 length:459 start_codon:yes stop_codon:yes gene_type:complete